MQQLADLAGQVGTNARKRCKLLRVVRLGELARKAADELRGAPVGSDAKAVLALDGKQIRHLIECGDDILVVRRQGNAVSLSGTSRRRLRLALPPPFEPGAASGNGSTRMGIQHVAAEPANSPFRMRRGPLP